MAAPQASSRLELLQARFQQKQLQEKEQKLLQLYDQQQQRAYQVVQRGNASSNHATITQHTVTKTSSSSSSHATSTSQGGKVRQMFDERRQTTVKGIDRSYPLEPLENKPRKQANGNGVQKNGNLTVSRQSVTVKRVARADVNSNLNGGKPVVSYHEEIARETFGPSARQDDDEFEIENHVAQYSNGNHRDETRIEEVVDQDTIERNRMMAKLHLMEYDETLKHRVKNDLESEEFPEDFMVDVPDKLPKQSVTKKLSQAEARLKRFKNANAKRGNNVTKSQTIALKKRTDPIFPAKFSPRECRVVKDGGARKVSDGRWNEGRKNVGMAVPSNSERRPRSSREESEKSRAIDSNTGTSLKEKNSENSKFLREEMSATARGSSSESFENRVRRGEGSNLFDKEFESSKTARKLSPELSKSPKFFNEESENSCSIDSKTARKLSLSRSSRDENLMRFERFDSRTASRVERNESPTKFYCEENEKSATTYAIDSKSRPSGSPDYMRNTESFVLKIEPKSRKGVIDSATKKSTNLRKSSSPEYSKSVKAESPDVLTREKGGGSSPRLFNRERRKSASFEHSRSTCKSPNLTEMDMNNSENRGRESADFTRKRSNTSPQFFSSDRSATIMIVTPETITKTEIADRSKRGERFSGKTSLNKETDSKHFARTSVSRYLPEKTLRNEEEMKKRNSSRGSSPLSSKGKRTPDPKPRFHHEKTTNRIDGVSSSRDSSPKSQRTVNSREETPELFRYESGKSATTVNLERSSKATMDVDVRSKGKSMEQRETKSKTIDRESEHTLRSTKLIRDTMMNQNQVDYVSIKRGKVDERVEIQAVESSPKSCTSVEIQEITMPDRGYLKQSRDACSKSGKEKTLADSGKSSKLSSKKKTVHDTLKQRGAKVNKGICEGKNIFKPREQTTPSPIQARKRRTEKYSRSPSDESMARNAKRKTSVVRATNRKNEGKTCSSQGEILKSMELVRRAMRGSSFHVETAVEEEQIDSSTIEESGGGVFSTNSALNYVRTDSVESALRRFDSIGTEAGSTRSVESTRRQTESYDGILDRSDLNLSRSPVQSFVVSCARKTSRESLESGCREGVDFAEENGRKKLCKRKLFHETDPTFDETERSNLEWLVGSNGKKTREHSVKIRLEFDSSDETSRGATTDKGETGETSTGADRSLSVRRLRSIEDIRKSIEGESEPVIESGRSGRGTGRSEAARRTNIDDRAGSRGEGMFLPGRSGNVAARNKGMGDTSRSAVKCAMRFPRVVKSPSPETVKTAETSNRARRNVPPSPSKSPDTMPRRASTELKVQDTKSTKRGTPMKGAEPIGNRKAMTTTTTTTMSTTSAASTRKSTDVVDGAILENGLHLRDQTAETKYDNDSPTMKKSDAFVIDFDEQPPKENDAPLPRKPFLRKQSTEKQITPTQSLRTPMSISSTSSGISTQNQTSVYRSKMASRAKTPISTTSYKGSTSNKNGGAAAGGAAATETLVPCKACGRRFAPDRVALHEQICIKTGQKKRKQFDTMMYRVKGTDIEPFVKKGLVKKQMEKSKKPEVKSNWRRKHEDFINAIRSAKQVQAHLAAGGKLSDLPPPPVSDNYDYIQCPHCGRKFNKAAADRHIPKCEHMLHNKPIHSRAPKPKR